MTAWSAEDAALEAWRAHLNVLFGSPVHPSVPQPEWLAAMVPLFQAAHDANRTTPSAGSVEAMRDAAVKYVRDAADWELRQARAKRPLRDAELNSHAAVVLSSVAGGIETLQLPAALPPATLADVLAMRAALEQAQDCIRGETPEDCTPEEAREDTLQKIRKALGL